jgi:hypothetical protein
MKDSTATVATARPGLMLERELLPSRSKQAIKTMAMGRVKSEQSETKSGDIAMYFEVGIAVAAVFGLLALGAWVWILVNADSISSIQRLHEMI